MFETNNNKKGPLKWIIGLLSVGFILFVWIKKDLLAIYSSLPQEEVLPVLATTVATTLLKFALLAGVIYLFKWIGSKIDTADNAS